MELSPIVLFVYNRPIHTEQTLTALMENDLADKSTLYIYSDGPQYGADEENVAKIKEVRRLIRSKQWCKEVHVIESEDNKGLADSIVDGVTKVVIEHGRVIVLEDDLVTSKGFLKYMNEALALYKYEKKIMNVNAYLWPIKIELKTTTFFLKIPSFWAWGTWKRAWEHYNNDIETHIYNVSKSKFSIKKFNIDGHATYYNQLIKNKDGRIKTWGVRWYASCWENGGYSLFPYHSLVKNIGHDGTGEHCPIRNVFDVKLIEYLKIARISIVENQKIRKSVDRFFKKAFHKKNLIKILSVIELASLKNALKKIFFN